MLLTRETDYALRIIRSLQDGSLKSVGEISKLELIPQQFAYKIIKKLAKAGFIEVTRGIDGGSRLTVDLSTVSLYDLMAAMEDHCIVNACMESGYRCSWAEQKGLCRIHDGLCSIQRRLNEELRSHSLKTLLGNQ